MSPVCKIQLSLDVKNNLQHILMMYKEAHRHAPVNSMPTGFFHLGVHVPFYLHFGGAMYPLTLHLGVQRKLAAFSPLKVVHHAVFLAKTFFFCLTLGQTGSGVLSDPWPLCLFHHFFVILYITCQICFLYRTECKITYIQS